MLAADAEAMAELFGGVSDAVQGQEPDRLVSAVSRWRRRHAEALLVVDQFEELFTLNVPEVQARFARLLGRLVDESGLRVVLGLRDDFFMRCGEHPALAPVFHDVTPLLPPSPEGLKRALREPAARQGVRFEDEALVEEMTAAVSAERGALPLLAFAASRLWEERDRERRLLTREAYVRIGGMAGALAQHAEATLQRLGTGREPMVRELFRNLATAEGTRASRGRAELLSVFGEGGAEAEGVLDALVAARLLTEYDAPERVEAGANPETPASSTQRIEIVHESLLTHWPRLVRWQTQDADGAQLRDQLRQAAHLWNERDRREDLLWTGASYVDYLAWRSHYPGQLSSLEEDFAQAMTGLANRRRRRRRIAVAAVVAVMAVGLGVLATFWSRSETARRKADAEALRAEASKLLALGQTEQERYPTAALAYAIKSLELADTEEARRFALRVLQAAPTALLASDDPTGTGDHVAFSPNGQWLSLAGGRTLQLLPWDGREPIAVAADFATTGWTGSVPSFGRDGDVLVGGGIGDLRTWSVPEGRELRRLKLRTGGRPMGLRERRRFPRLHDRGREGADRSGGSIREGGLRLVGSMEAPPWVCPSRPSTRPALSSPMASVATSTCARCVIGTPRRGSSARMPAEVIARRLPSRRPAAGSDATSPARSGSGPPPGRRGAPARSRSHGDMALGYSPGGRWLGAFGDVDGIRRAALGPSGAGLGRTLAASQRFPGLHGFAFDPGERWLATGPPAALWPLGESYPRSLKKHEEWVNDVAFSVDGSTLLSASGDQTLRAWPMSPEPPRRRASPR